MNRVTVFFPISFLQKQQNLKRIFCNWLLKCQYFIFLMADSLSVEISHIFYFILGKRHVYSLHNTLQKPFTVLKLCLMYTRLS